MRQFSIGCVFLLFGFCSLAVGFIPQLESSKAKYDDWISDDGQRFKIRLDVVLPDGQPASDFTAKILDPDKQDWIKIVGNKITANLNVKAYSQLGTLKVATNDGRFLKFVSFPAHDLRNIAAKGQAIALAPVKTINVRVVDPTGTPVPDATVNGTYTTDKNGLTSVQHPLDIPLYSISAIAPNRDAGTIYFSRLTKEEQDQDVLEIKLQGGFKQTVKLIDDRGNPAVGVQIIPQTMGTGGAFVSANHKRKTNEKGEVLLTWFPKLPGARAFIMVFDDNWYVESQDRQPEQWKLNVLPLQRKEVQGKVNLPEGVKGGFLVQLTGFDHPTPNRADQVYARTDSTGVFTANVLPDVPYGVYVADSNWSSNFWDGVLVDRDGNTNEPYLTLSSGEPVKIVATVSEGRSPMSNTAISMSRPFSFKTKKGNGNTGPRWWVTTDDDGVALAFSAPGKLEASIFSNDYNDTKKMTVKKDGKNEISFHRKSTESQSISGQLMPLIGTNLAEASIHVQATDGKARFQGISETSAEGKFEMKGMGERFAVLAMTADASAAGYIFTNSESAKSLQIPLAPTSRFKGKLLDAEGRPFSNCKVLLEVRLTDPLAEDLGFFQMTKLMTKLSTTTNEEGEFEFVGTPVGIPLVLRINDTKVMDEGRSYLGTRMLIPDTTRPRETFQLRGPAGPMLNKTITKRLNELYRDCRLVDANALICILGKGKELEGFLQKNLTDQELKESFWYLPSTISYESSQRPECQEVIARHDWSLPRPNQIILHATNSSGENLDSLTIDISDRNAAAKIKTFIVDNKGPTHDAKTKFTRALEEARNTNRKIWAVTGHTRCSPCFAFARWLENQKKLLEKDYILVKIDSVRDENSAEVTKMICEGKHLGVPFHSIFTPDGSIVITSEGPLGNIGHPAASFEGKHHLRKMLIGTSVNLTKLEIDELILSLDR